MDQDRSSRSFEREEVAQARYRIVILMTTACVLLILVILHR
jgi:hypothetical protein